MSGRFSERASSSTIAEHDSELLTTHEISRDETRFVLGLDYNRIYQQTRYCDGDPGGFPRSGPPYNEQIVFDEEENPLPDREEKPLLDEKEKPLPDLEEKPLRGRSYLRGPEKIREPSSLPASIITTPSKRELDQTHFSLDSPPELYPFSARYLLPFTPS